MSKQATEDMIFSWIRGLAVKKSVKKMVFSLLHRLFIVDGTVRGFLLKRSKPSSYSASFDVIKKGN